MTYIFDDTTGGSPGFRISTHYHKETKIEFNEDLILYKVQIYDSDASQTYEHYIVATDFEDARSIAKAYFETDCGDSITGVWEVDAVVSRRYN